MANNREISQFAGLVTVNDTSSDVSIGASVTVGTGITFNAGAGTAQFAGNTTFGGDADADIDAEGVYLGADGKIRARASSGSAYCFIGSQKGSGTSTTVINGEGAATFASGKFDLDANGRLNLRNDISSGQILQCYSGGWTGGDRVASILSTGAATFAGTILSGGPAVTGGTDKGSYIGYEGNAGFTAGSTSSAIRVWTQGTSTPTLDITGAGAATFKGKIEAGTSSTDHGVEAQSGSSTASYASVSARNYTSGGNVWQGKNAASGTQTSKITETGAATFDKSVDSPAYFGDNYNSGGATSNVTFSIDNNGASMALYSIYCSFYGGSTATTPYNSHITFMIRNGGAGANGHISVDYGTITATESYDSGNDEFDITLTTPSSTRAYGLARVIRIS